MDVDLLVTEGATEDPNGHRFGGHPVAPEGFVWPTCATCAAPMQFLGQLRLDERRLLSLFMCQADPGQCEEWDADEGGNAAFVFEIADGLAPVTPPDGETTLRGHWGGRVERRAVDEAALGEFETAYDVARSAWAAEHGRRRDVLGALGGEPAWIQGDETPACDDCDEEMTFAAQLEEGPDYATAMSFGGGCAYAFVCGCGAAKMCWQQ